MSVKSPNILTDTLHNVDNVDDMHSVGIAEEEDTQSVQDSGLQNLSEQVELNGPDVQNWADDVDAAWTRSVDDNASLFQEDTMSNAPIKSSRPPSRSQSSEDAQSSLGAPSLLGFPKTASRFSSQIPVNRIPSSNSNSNSIPSSHPLPQEKPPCQEQLRYGTCKYAPNCPYRHMSEQELLYFANLVGNAMAQPLFAHTAPVAPVAPPRAVASPTVPCRYFAMGTCTRGSTCPFLHGQSYSTASSAGFQQSPYPANVQPCKFYLSGVGCRKGNACHFAHVEESGDMAQSANQMQESEIPRQSEENASQNGDVGWGDTIVGGDDWGNDKSWNSNASGWGTPKSKTEHDPWASNSPQVGNNSFDQRQQVAPRLAVCRQYSQGSCRYNPCKYSHDLSMNPVPSSSSRQYPPERVPSQQEPEQDEYSNEQSDHESEASEDPWLSSDSDGSDDTAKNDDNMPTQNIPGEPASDTALSEAEDADLASSEFDQQTDDIPQPDEPTWSQSWDNSPAPEENVDQIVRRRVPCLGFGQGYCQHGDSCFFLHIDPETGRDARLVEPDPLDNDTSATEQLIEPTPQHEEFFGCQITFAEDTSIEAVQTSYESNCVEISGIPYGMTESQMSDLCASFGVIQTMGFDPPGDEESGDTQTMWVVYTNHQAAFESMTKLNGHEVSESGMRLQTTLRLRTSPGIIPKIAFIPSVHTPQTLKIEWPTPHVSVFPYYHGIAQARAATNRLNGRVFEGRLITASFKPPKGGDPNQLVGVCIDGVHVDVTDPRGATRKLMEKAVSPPDKPEAFSHLTVSSATYSGSPIPQIEALLGATNIYGRMDIVSDSPSEPKGLAFTTFKSPFQAAAVANRLHNAHRSWIGKGGRLDVQVVYSRQYRLRQELYGPVQRSIQRLQAGYAQEPFADAPMIKLYRDPDDEDIFVVRVYGSNLAALQRVYKDIQPCVHGQLVELAAGESLEDAFNFSGFLQNMLYNIRDKPFTILPDLRLRKLYAFGVPEERQKAMKAVQKVHQRRKANTLHVPLDRNLIAQLMRGGLNRAKDLVEEKNVVLDLVSSRPGSLKVGLKDKTSAEILREIETASAGAIPAQSMQEEEASLCALCCLQVVEPVKIECGHQFCSSCIQQYLVSLLNLRFERVACPAGCAEDVDPCPGNVSSATVRAVLSLQHVESLREIAFTCYVASRPHEYGVCPLSGCQMVYRTCPEGTTIQCPNCQNWICAHCHEEAHEGVLCRSLGFGGWPTPGDVDNMGNHEMVSPVL